MATDFFSSFPEVSFAKHQLIFGPGQPLTTIYYLESGQVRMYAISETGKELTLHLFTPGSYLPIMLSLSGVENEYFFETTESTKTREIPATEMMEYLKTHPEEQQDLLVRFSKAIVGLITRIQSLSTLNTAEQIESLLEYLESHHNLTDPTNQELANWLGTARETVSRKRKN